MGETFLYDTQRQTQSHTIYANSPHGYRMGTPSHTQMYSHTHKYTEMRNTHIKIAYTLLRVRLTHKLRDRALPGRPQHAHIFTGSQPYLAGQALALLSHPQAAQPSLSHLPTPIREGAGACGAPQCNPGRWGDSPHPARSLRLKTGITMRGGGEETPVYRG